MKLNITKNVINEKWEEYIKTVSSKGHASSYELCNYIYEYLKKHNPKYVLDMGSGFSSFTTRYYQKEHNPNAVVYSVDDNSDWIKKTQAYLQQENLSTENLVLFDDFKETELKFDFILYDLGRIPTRIKNIDFPLTVAKSGSVILYDDIHFDKTYSNKVNITEEPYLQDVFFDYVDKMNLKFKKLTETYDEFGRYCMEVIVP